MSRESRLVDTTWLEGHLDDPSLVVVEIDEKPLVYNLGHVPGAHALDWRTDIQEELIREIPGPGGIEELWRRIGLTPDSTVVFYGDKSNWYAAFALWLFRLYGFDEVRLLDGGRQRWILEERPLSTARPAPVTAADIPTPRFSSGLRTSWREIPSGVQGGAQLLDVRTAAEYRGTVITEPGYLDESAQRPGHIPSAIGIPWDEMLASDGTLLGDDEIREVLDGHGFDPDRPTIVYCRIGERSAHTWFVLAEILGLEASNYDGSWIEWGSMVGMPIAIGEERGDPAALGVVAALAGAPGGEREDA